MQHTVLFFGRLAEITTQSSIAIEAVDTDSLLTAVLQEYPELQKQNFAIAVNKTIVSGNVALTQESTVALLPPFSGG